MPRNKSRNEVTETAPEEPQAATEQEQTTETTPEPGPAVPNESPVKLPVQEDGESPEAYLVRLQAFVKTSAVSRHTDAIVKMVHDYETANGVRVKSLIWRYAKGTATVAGSKPEVTVKLFAGK